MNLRTQRGFTLIEIIFVVVIVGIAAVAIGGMQSSLFRNQAVVNALQVQSHLQTECAEIVLTVVRQDGYGQVSSPRFTASSCDTLTAFGANALPAVTITDPYTGASCPTGFNCKLVNIRQGSLSPLSLLLVNY